MIVEYKNQGAEYLEYDELDGKIMLGSKPFEIDCVAEQRDWPVHIVVYADRKGDLFSGYSEDAWWTCAEVYIPERMYTYPPAGEEGGEVVAWPLDMDKVKLVLFYIN